MRWFFLFFVSLFFFIFGDAGFVGAEAFPRAIVPGLQLVGRMRVPGLRESSGLVASRQFTNVFWTHNDKGSASVLYAMTRDGALLAQFTIVGAALSDWEDLADDGAGNLYLADTGNNGGKRNELAVHRIVEPDPKTKSGDATVTRSWRLRFPGQPFDCESLFVLGTNAYVFSKVFDDARATIFRFPLSETTDPLVLEAVTETKITSPVTGATLSRDGVLLGVVTKAGAWVYQINGEVRAAGTVAPHRVKFKDHHIEACAFVPEGLMATAESGELYLFNDAAFRPGGN